MKAVINGRVYNTETADLVCEWSYGEGNDFRWHETALHRSKKGTFFLAGSGGPGSMWCEYESGHYSSGSGVRVLTPEEALQYMEEANCLEEVYRAFGFSLEEG